MVRLHPRPLRSRSATSQRGSSSRGWRFALSRLLAALVSWFTVAQLSAADTGTISGLPFSRFYSYEEIGNASRGARLGFDLFGRLAITYQGSYEVLNDNTWIDLTDKKTSGDKMQQVIFDPEGKAYYGALSSWGTMEFTPEGLMRPQPLMRKPYPDWVMASNFMDLLLTKQGVLFASFHGVIHWDRATGKHLFFEVPQVSRVFRIHDEVFIWSHRVGIQRLDFASEALVPVTGVNAGGNIVDQVTALDEGHVLVATFAGRLLVFDGQQLTPWTGPLANQPNRRVSALHRLADGNIAIAVSGRGLYIVSGTGDVISSFTSPEYHRIIELAAREPGVLWIETERGVEKVLYESALTIFGQRVGLPISWPQVVQWRDRVVVASSGKLYQAVPGAAGDSARFELIPGQPRGEIWAVAANGDQLLAGNSNEIFAGQDDGTFVSVLSRVDVARLVMVSPDLCFAIGANEITALRRANGQWSEAAPRIPGFGYPSVVMAAKGSAWIELAANRVARVALRDGKLEARVLERFPWEPSWINLGVVGDIVVLAAPGKGRLYFDEKTEALVEEPALARLLDALPHPVARVREDEAGTLWASYEQGLLMVPPTSEDALPEPIIFNVTNERFPLIHLLRGGDVWMSTGQSLYRVDRRRRPPAEPTFRPMLVSVVDGRTNRELRGAKDSVEGEPLRLKYAENHLMLQFFAGSYAGRRTPTYEFKLNRGRDAWVPMAAGSLLTLNDLRQGSYRLAVRLAGQGEGAGDALALEFEIAPPWFCTWYAYTFYTLAAIGAVLLLIRLVGARARQRNLVLEKIVRERTDELRVAMEQLNEETRNAATVAERNRLAGEIHDSLQQGLSGLILQLDATLKLPGLSPDLRSRLHVARNMVSFTRHEVQHAVWDLESPLLEDAELGTALQKIATLISPGVPQVDIQLAGSSAALSSATKHHLLRIAQEAITNAVRHSAAQTISVLLTCENDVVTLSVTDNGNGFVPADALANGIGHFGLRGLRGRAAKIGGDLQISSAPGQGTSIRIVVNGASARSHASTR